MTSGTFFWLTNVNCTSGWKKKKWPTLGGLSPVCIRQRERKNTKINVTFSLSGWAMPFLQWRPGLWQMLRLSLRTESLWSASLRRVRRKTFSAYLLAGPISRPWPGPAGSCHRARCWDTLIWPHASLTARPAAGCQPDRFTAATQRTHQVESSLRDQAPAAVCSAEKSLAVLTHSDKIHFIGFVLKFDIGSGDSNFMSRIITIAAGIFKKCVYSSH